MAAWSSTAHLWPILQNLPHSSQHTTCSESVCTVTRRYFYRSQSDYGAVENSAQAAASDEAVLDAELDLDKLRGDGEGGRDKQKPEP